MQHNAKVLFAGLGSMGALMARNLIGKGFTVYGMDVNAEAVRALHAESGTPVLSGPEAARACDFAILMVVNAAQAEDVLFDKQVAANMRQGAIVLLMATCSPAEARRIGGRVTDMGLRFVDAPVSGGMAGARAGTLSIMAGAAEETWELARPVLEALGERLCHAGTEPGQGAAVKAINQLLCGTHIAVAAEAFSLAKKAGLDPRMVFEVVSNSAASSWMLRDRGPRMLSDGEDVASAIDIFVKDLGIVVAAGAEYKAAVPLASVALQMFSSASGRGEGKRDDSKVIRGYDLLNGLDG